MPAYLNVTDIAAATNLTAETVVAAAEIGLLRAAKIGGRYVASGEWVRQWLTDRYAEIRGATQCLIQDCGCLWPPDGLQGTLLGDLLTDDE